jgi:hypothetical protein
MDTYELREIAGRLRLSGGQLTAPLTYPAADKDSAIRVVGFLSQRHGSILRIFGAADELIESQRREPVVPLKGAVGGLEGPR